MVGFKGTVEKKIGGKKRTLKFGTNQTAIVTDLYDIPLKKFSEEFGEDEMGVGKMRDMVYAALAAGELSKGKIESLSELSFTRWQVGDWLDELDGPDVQDIFEAMGEEVKDADGKKKGNGKAPAGSK